MNFPRCDLFCCCILLFLDGRPLQLDGCHTFQIPLLGGQKICVVCALVELGGQQKSFAVFFRHFLIKQIMVEFFLGISVLPYDVSWKPFCSARVTINMFACSPGNSAVFVNVTWCIFPSRSCQPCQSPRFVPVIVLRYPAVTFISVSLRLIIFSSEFTIYDVAP